MANRRMLDSAFWEDRAVQAKLSRTARYLFIGLISHADDEGRAVADPRWLKSRVFLYDDDVAQADVQHALEEIAAVCPSVCLYTHDGEQYVAFLKWEQYQSIKNSRGSSLPKPPADPIPPAGKPGPKRKLAGDSDNEPIGSDSSPILSDEIANELPANGNRIAGELGTREVKRREEKRRESKTPFGSASGEAPPDEPDPPNVKALRPGVELFRDVFRRFPPKEFWPRFEAALAAVGPALYRRRLEEWRDKPGCSPTSYSEMLDVVTTGWLADGGGGKRRANGQAERPKPWERAL